MQCVHGICRGRVDNTLILVLLRVVYDKPSELLIVRRASRMEFQKRPLCRKRARPVLEAVRFNSSHWIPLHSNPTRFLRLSGLHNDLKIHLF